MVHVAWVSISNASGPQSSAGGGGAEPHSRSTLAASVQEDLGRLFGMLASGAIRPRVAERISFDRVAEAHRRIEAGGLKGKLVLCPEIPSERDGVSGRGLAAPAFPLPPERSSSPGRLLW